MYKKLYTAWKVSEIGAFSGLYFPVFWIRDIALQISASDQMWKIQTKRNFECVHFSHRRNRKFCSIVPTSSKSILKVSKVRYFHLSKNEIFSWGLLHTAYKMKFSINNFFSKCDRIRNFLKKSLMENLIFCAVSVKVGTHWRFSNR